jgi:hypothetical protein
METNSFFLILPGNKHFFDPDTIFGHCDFYMVTNFLSVQSENARHARSI